MSNVPVAIRAALEPQVNLIPGMPADVLITTEHRTFIHYLFKPFLDAFSRSFHET